MLEVTRKGLSLYEIELPDYNDQKALKSEYERHVVTVFKGVKESSDVEKFMNLPFCIEESALSVMKLYVRWEARGERREARGERREARGERREARGERREEQESSSLNLFSSVFFYRLQAMWMSSYVTGKPALAALLSVILVTTTMEKVHFYLALSLLSSTANSLSSISPFIHLL